MKIPVIELSDCIRCDVCVEVSPRVFMHNESDFIQIAVLSEYPEKEVDDAIRYCPARCISWGEE
ncbi:MAG: ferredoxin [Thermodesulfobacteriota bacterium]